MKQSCKIVGIGASAGGLQPLISFIGQIASTNKASFVVVQHMSASRQSQLDQILAAQTDIPVIRVVDSIEMKENHIYVMAEGTELEVHDNMLQVFERDPNAIINKAIDRLFFSMAANCKDRAVGIVLSGTGNDGLAGAKAIEAKGGKIFTQSPETAQFDGMPNAIIQHDHPDMIDDPVDLAKAVNAMINEVSST